MAALILINITLKTLVGSRAGLPTEVFFLFNRIMKNEEILPILDIEVLKNKAQESAMKGAIKEIEDYYNSYNSPYKDAIKEELKKQKTKWSISLPDILATINDKLTEEIDLIANKAVSKSFVPMVQKFLTREEKEINFSYILEEFISTMKDNLPYGEELDEYSFEVEVKKHDRHDWLCVEIMSEKQNYSMTLHTSGTPKEGEKQKYQILSLPHTDSSSNQTMTLKINGVSLEMPFTKDVLKDGFTSFIAKLIIADSDITMDCTDFNEDMFPRDECYCD